MQTWPNSSSIRRDPVSLQAPQSIDLVTMSLLAMAAGVGMLAARRVLPEKVSRKVIAHGWSGAKRATRTVATSAR